LISGTAQEKKVRRCAVSRPRLAGYEILISVALAVQYYQKLEQSRNSHAAGDMLAKRSCASLALLKASGRRQAPSLPVLRFLCIKGFGVNLDTRHLELAHS